MPSECAYSRASAAWMPRRATASKYGRPADDPEIAEPAGRGFAPEGVERPGLVRSGRLGAADEIQARQTRLQVVGQLRVRGQQRGPVEGVAPFQGGQVVVEDPGQARFGPG